MSKAQAASSFTLNETHGLTIADSFLQRAFMNHVYLTVLTSPSTVGTLITIDTLITADRTFCGNYNKEDLTRAKRRLEELIANGITAEIIIVGCIAHCYSARQFLDTLVCSYMTGVNSLTAECVITTVSQFLL